MLLLVLLQKHIKDPCHCARSTAGRLQLGIHAPSQSECVTLFVKIKFRHGFDGTQVMQNLGAINFLKLKDPLLIYFLAQLSGDLLQTNPLPPPGGLLWLPC